MEHADLFSVFEMQGSLTAGIRDPYARCYATIDLPSAQCHTLDNDPFALSPMCKHKPNFSFLG